MTFTVLDSHAAMRRVLTAPVADRADLARPLLDQAAGRYRYFPGRSTSSRCTTSATAFGSTATTVGPAPGWAAPAEVGEAWRIILASDGRLPVVSVAAAAGWGRRHRGEQFRLATGLTPKEAARVARFERVKRLLRAGDRPLADVAAEAGYADQAHLSREWRPLTGASMTTWLREELPLVQDAAGTARIGAMSTDEKTLPAPVPTVWPSVGFTDVDAGGVMFGTRGKPGAWGALAPTGVHVVAAEAATVDAAWSWGRDDANFEATEALHDTDYGSRGFGVRDRDGTLWTIGTYRGASSPV